MAESVTFFRGCPALLALRSAMLALTSLRSCRVPSPCPAIASATADLAIFFVFFSKKRDRSSRDNGTARHLAAARLPRLPCASPGLFVGLSGPTCVRAGARSVCNTEQGGLTDNNGLLRTVTDKKPAIEARSGMRCRSIPCFPEQSPLTLCNWCAKLSVNKFNLYLSERLFYGISVCYRSAGRRSSVRNDFCIITAAIFQLAHDFSAFRSDAAELSYYGEGCR